MQTIEYVEDVYNNASRITMDGLTNFLGREYYRKGIYNSEIKEKIKNRKLLFVDHNLNNQRIIMQQGLFMFPFTLDKNQYEDVLYRNTCTITIPRNLRTKLLRILDDLGFNIYKLMPDLSSICQEITVRAEKDEEGTAIIF